LNYKTLESLIASVGYGKITPTPVIRKFFPQDQHIPQQEPSALRKIIRAVTGKPSEGILIKGVEDVLVRLCKGCNPLPGDNVIGFITRGRGVTVHTTSCPKALEADPERRIEVQWSSTDGQVRLAKIKVVCVDRPGMLANITQSIAAFHVNIQKASAKGIKDQKAVNIFELAVKNLAHLKEVIRSVEKVSGVISVERV
jgi:GTP pyrophosphokinase